MWDIQPTEKYRLRESQLISKLTFVHHAASQYNGKATSLFTPVSNLSLHYSIVLITLAGKPTATLHAGTSLVTKAPLPMIAPSPM